MLDENFLHESIINRQISKRYGRDSYIETIEQYNRSAEVFSSVKTKDTAYIAPTSYGKSSIVREVILQNEFNRIAVIVPTKSLITQTYNDIRKLNLNYKLILHDEMYTGQEKFIGILTQERATRLINKFNICFDILFIDEAHNLLSTDSRNLLLSRLIMLNYKSNKNQRLLFLSPLVSDISNLKIKNTSEGPIAESVIKHNLKAYEVFYLDKRNRLSAYNRFTDDLYPLASNTNFIDYITTRSKEKNFVYNYRPKNVEKIAEEIYNNISVEIESPTIRKISKVIETEISEDINVVQYILKGIVYLHGKMPTILKEYLEYNYKELPEFKYVVANSVILEGINFPIDNLYITSTFGLKAKGLNNLIGRVNRLNYVFRENSIEKIISNIHFVDSETYTDSRSNMINKIVLLREHTFTDENKNPLLENYNVDNLGLSRYEKESKIIKDNRIIDATDFLINREAKNQSDRIKLNFIENNIDDFYKNVDTIIPTVISNIQKITDPDNVIQTIYEVFIQNLSYEIKDFEVERLKNEKARNYYKYYIELFQLFGLKEKINDTIKYFEIKAQTADPFLYIGSSFGDTIRQSAVYTNSETQQEVYINLQDKNRQRLANIALIKIKLEEDFVSFKIKKLIAFLFDFNLISEKAYFLAVYGTADVNLINLTRIGLGPNIIRLLNENEQIKNIQFDDNGNLISNSDFKQFIRRQPELVQFEINKYVR
ncbi:DEAD/DEAH box helicase [Flavobacterium humidisoli]|uniref:DEAD/DEAH box helicase n=1 Tax=Flavobacterium humidisoli TaxID=2937442 RepID=A0ABY4M1C1_9FLAO|nr:DEAD/DEAH box helicase [Flavobacterium humidisoli]UPZ17806.1 DEAD/DEAH box helicase [Flavobacterium humidisoli]